MVGRDDDIARLSAQLTAARFVTIVGSGGVGKTTVAVAVAHHLMEAFSGAVLFVDLGMLSDPDLVATAAASMLGLSVRSDDATPSLIAYLRDKRILLILDTCEHLIEAVAELASQIFAAAPERPHPGHQPRGAAGRRRACLPAGSARPARRTMPSLTAASVQTFPATQLFVERAMASGARLDLSDADAALVGDICRKLDGVALAIELAARRVESYGLQQTAALLDQHLTLLWAGPRTAPPRQKTLQATLDWSFGLLSDLERQVLRRLAVFVGHFTLDAALEVVSSATLDQSVVLGAIDSLVAKSMVATRPIGAMMRYRLLDTTRAYALDIGIDRRRPRRPGRTPRRLLPALAGAVRDRMADPVDRDGAVRPLRRAQQRPGGAGMVLRRQWRCRASASGLPPPPRRFSSRCRCCPNAIAGRSGRFCALDETTRGGRRGDASAGGPRHFVDATCTARARRRARPWTRASRSPKPAAMASTAWDCCRLRHMFHFRGGEFKPALQYATQCRAIAGTIEDPAAMALAHSILGRSLHMAGDHGAARVELEALMAQRARTRHGQHHLSRLRPPLSGGIALARTLWLQGHPDAGRGTCAPGHRDAAAPGPS